MMKLYWCPRTRSFTALWLMEEVGKPYERVLVDMAAGEQKGADYRAVNPMGKVPALQDGDVTMAEAAAICAYVAERNPDANLAPRSAIPCAQSISTGCFTVRVASSPRSMQIGTKLEMNPVAAGWGDAERVIDVLDGAPAEGSVAARRKFHRRRHRDRLQDEFCRAAVQDDPGAAILRCLHRALHGAPGVPARRENRGGVTATKRRSQPGTTRGSTSAA